MRTLLFSLIAFLLPLTTALASQDCNSGSMTGTDFQLGLGCLDPFSASHDGSGGSVPGGVQALMILLKNISEFLLFLMPIIAVISVLVAGYFYIFSAGDSEKTSKAKIIIKWNLVALLVAFLSWSLVQIVALLLTQR